MRTFAIGQPVYYLTWAYLNRIQGKVFVPASVVALGPRRVKLAFAHPETNEPIERYVDTKNVVPMEEEVGL